jgi:hypothetical protein
MDWEWGDQPKPMTKVTPVRAPKKKEKPPKPRKAAEPAKTKKPRRESPLVAEFRSRIKGAVSSDSESRRANTLARFLRFTGEKRQYTSGDVRAFLDTKGRVTPKTLRSYRRHLKGAFKVMGWDVGPALP